MSIWLSTSSIVNLLRPAQALQAAQGHLGSPHALGAGSVFSWGRGEFGALGHGDAKDRALPRIVDALRGMCHMPYATPPPSHQGGM